jgi:hypothetical protein
MPARKTGSAITLVSDQCEVRDLLTGEVIGRVSCERLRRDGGLERALRRHGFTLVRMQGNSTQAEVRRNAA